MSRSFKDEEHKQASCDDKQRLTKAVADRISKQADKHVVPYHCKYCGSWHVGSKNRKIQSNRDHDS